RCCLAIRRTRGSVDQGAAKRARRKLVSETALADARLPQDNRYSSLPATNGRLEGGRKLLEVALTPDEVQPPAASPRGNSRDRPSLDGLRLALRLYSTGRRELDRCSCQEHRRPLGEDLALLGCLLQPSCRVHYVPRREGVRPSAYERLSARHS